MSDTDLTREQLLQELATAQETIALLEQTVQSLTKTKQSPARSAETNVKPLPSPALVYRILYRLIQQLPIGIQIFNIDGLCIDVNNAYLSTFKINSRNSLVGKYNLFTDPAAQNNGISQCGQQALQGNVVQIPELHINAIASQADADALPGPLIVRVTVLPIKDAHNQVGQIVVLSENVTERTLVEQTAKQMEQKYKSLVEQLPAITYTVDFNEPKFRTTYISPQVQELLGFSVEEWLNEPDLWIKQLHPEDRDHVLAEVHRKDAAGESLDIEYRVLARDGSVRWFSNKNTIISEKNRPRLAHGIMFDITQQKKMETQLRQIQRMEAIGQMAGGMAHNFNNLLTSLIGHTELALNILDEDHPVHHDLLVIRKSATRAGELTRQLLAFTRNQHARPAVLNLSELLVEVEPILTQLVPSEFEFKVEPDPNLWGVKADPNQIEQILVNLVVNARDALSDGGQITVKTSNRRLSEEFSTGQHKIPPGGYVLLTVADTGSGIPESVRPHIFEPFFTTKEVGQGTGLGLSTCFGIVQQSQGFITVDSVEGQGTTFIIYLPRVDAATKDEAVVAAVHLENISPPDNMGAILLVDDAFLIRNMSARVLRQQGFSVMEAANGQEAITLLSKPALESLALLITDVSMPAMNGVQLANQVVKQYPEAKVLFISGHTDRALVSRGVDKIEHAVLTKPFTPKLLLQAVDNLLKNRPQQNILP